ncbi:MAG: hypothetical protein EOO88_21725, partial [Pedobacter sp.]
MNHNITRPIIKVPIDKHQWLSELNHLYPLPTDAIIHKILPGSGATHGEINSRRDSIIILPNVPVIKSKVKKHNDKHKPEEQILGIYKGITTEHVSAYLLSNVKHKKILTTPEGYIDKFKKATIDTWETVIADFYLLIDECERMIQDSDYRDRIVEPFDDFFTFQNKGLISATTLPFSDPRLETFFDYVIAPTFGYERDLALIHTNNIVNAVREYQINTKADKQFIFLTSISTITAIIEALDIKEQSKIHCSENALKELRLRGFKADSLF